MRENKAFLVGLATLYHPDVDYFSITVLPKCFTPYINKEILSQHDLLLSSEEFISIFDFSLTVRTQSLNRTH